MKKYLIILAIAVFSIIPLSNVKAYDYELNNGSVVSLADLPNDGNNEFIILKNKNGYYHMYSYNSADFPNNYFFLRHGLSNVFYFGFNGSITYNWYYYSSSSNSWKFNKENDTCIGSCYFNTDDQSYVQVVYSTQDLIFLHNYQSYYTFVENSNFDVSIWNANDIVYYADKEKELLSFSYEKVETDNSNYYDFLFSINEYNSNYKYRVKFNDGAWHYLNKEYFSYQVLYNGTFYMQVLNENNESIETKTFTIADLSTKEEFYSPTIDINVDCSTDFYSNIEQAKINLTFNNYSTIYKYQYSFNNIDYTDINYTDISNKSYTITTYVNTPIYVRVLDLEGNIVHSNSSRVTCMLDSEQYYYYELSIDDLYNSETNELIYYTFLYENKKRDITPFVYFYYTGSDSLNFHISYDTEVTNFDMHYNNLTNNTLEDISCTTLPFEYIDDMIYPKNYTTYTMFSFMPCIDLSTFLYGEQYTDFKLIIKSNIELNIGEPITFGGAFLPSTNLPLDNSNYDSPFLDYFNNFVNEDFGLSAIVQAPLNFIKNLSNNTCTSLKLVMPIVNVEFELPCMSSVYSEYFGEWFTLYQTITTGVIAYWVCVKIFALVKDFHDPQNDKIEVMDL